MYKLILNNDSKNLITNYKDKLFLMKEKKYVSVIMKNEFTLGWHGFYKNEIIKSKFYKFF